MSSVIVAIAWGKLRPYMGIHGAKVNNPFCSLTRQFVRGKQCLAQSSTLLQVGQRSCQSHSQKCQNRSGQGSYLGIEGFPVSIQYGVGAS